MIKDLEKSNLGPYPEYGIARIPDLEQVPLHWEVRCLGQVGTLAKGIGGNKDDERPEGFPCVRYGDLYTTHRFFIEETRSFISQEDSIKYTELKLGDVLFAASGETTEEIGKSAANLIDGPAYCGGDIILFRPTADLHPRYCGYVFDCQPMAVQKAIMGRGFTVHHIYGRQLKYLRFALPPPEEQAAIVRFLYHADEQIQRYIAGKERLIALLEEERQALVHQAVTRGLDPSVRLKPSGVEWMGEVPEHWDVRRLRYLIQDKLKYGANAPAEFDEPDWPRYLRITDFTEEGRLREDNIRALPPEVADDYLVEPGDILLARSGATVGKAFLVPSNTRRMCHAGYLIRARAEQSVIDPRFLFTFTQSHIFDRWRRANLIISTIENISAEKYADLPVPTPTISEQREILEHLDGETYRIDKASQETQRIINLLQEYRTRLIADVVTGQLDVRDAAAQVQEAP